MTVIVELAIATPLLSRVEPSGLRRSAGIVIANLATHPLVWFVFPAAVLRFTTRIALSELWAFSAEVLVYRVIWPALSWRRALITSLLANAITALIGLVLRA